MSRGIEENEQQNLSMDFCKETIPQQSTSWSKSTVLRSGRPWPRDKMIIML